MESSGPVKLCKDCRWFREGTNNWTGVSFDICGHPSAMTDVIRGTGHATCELMRSRNCLIPACGFAGNWFEPKEQQS